MPSTADALEMIGMLVMRVERSLVGRGFEDLLANDEAYDALTYRLAMIGEACGKLPADLKARHPHLPWREMTAFRNFASHDYFGVDAQLVWRAAQGLGPIKAMVEQECAEGS